MVVLPKDFVATRFPGYFWNVAEQKLYSIKVTGELRALAFNKGGWYGPWYYEPGYRISQNGQKQSVSLRYLSKLTAKSETELETIGVYNVENC